MQTRVKKTSLIANEQTDKVTGKQRVLNCIRNYSSCSQNDISTITGLSRQTVSARINDLLYKDQKIKIKGTIKVGSYQYEIYRLRKDFEEPEQRKLSKSEQIIKRLEHAVNVYSFVGFIDARVIQEIIEKYK